MKTIKFFSAALFVLAASACNADYTTENFSNLEPMTIAGIETKTALNQADGSVNWTAGDQIAIYDNLGGTNIFNNTSDNVASFFGNVTAGTEQFWGVYPTNLITGFNNGTVTMTLPSDQTPVAGTFDEELNISVTSGMKTPGTELVEGVSFHNACGLIAFTVPANIAAQKVTFISDNSFLCGTLSVDCTTSEAVLSSNQSNSVSMTGDFAAGSTFYFVVAPGQIDGFSINVETKKGSYYSKNASQGKINVTAGSLTRLGQISFKAGAVTANAEHTYESDVLTGSSLTVNHGIPQNMWNDVTNLTVKVMKSDSTYRSYSAKVIESASVVPIGNTYLPHGSYDVIVEYTMNGEPTTIEVSVTVPKPDKLKLTITSIEATTSYSLAKKGEIEKANNHAADTITSPKAVFAGISADVLNFLQPTCSFSVSGKTNEGTVSGTNLSCSKFGGLSWGSHTLTATVTFDGVSSSATTTCHITGLPYTKNFKTDSNTDGWSISGTNKRESNRGYQLFYRYTSKKQETVMFSPSFKFPEATKIVHSTIISAGSTADNTKTQKAFTGLTTGTTINKTHSITLTESVNALTSGFKEHTLTKTENISNNQRLSISCEGGNWSWPVQEHFIYLCSLTIKYAN